ncbi:MAG: SDR family NAD(P)-dependent oxidoreductase [Solirubrobacterales bacterium]
MTKVCVISGAASGIGKATLELFSANGYGCVGVDSDEAAIDRLLSELDGAADRIRFVHADLLTEDEIDLGPIASPGGQRTELTLVNNLGGSRPSGGTGPLEPHRWEDFADVLTFNLKPLHTLTHACLEVMRDNEYGRIVNVSSVSGRRALGSVDPAYGAAKAAVIALSRHLALELAGDGVLVNTVCPGVIATDRMEQRWAARGGDLNQEVLRQIPLARPGRPEEVAEAIYHLGSTSTYTTGSILDVNGGMHLP